MPWATGGAQYVAPQFLIVDSDALDVQLRPLAGIRDHYSPPGPYLLLLRDDHSPLEIVDALEAGVDDFLNKPLNHAEVLARLRAGARYLEWRRKDDDLLQTDPVTGLMTAGAFARLLRHQAAKTTAPGCCVLLELDHFDAVNTAIGWSAARGILQAVAELVRDRCGSNQSPAKWQGSRFAVLLPNTSLEQARRWAEGLREAVAECRCTPEVVESLRLTVSVGVGVWRPGVRSSSRSPAENRSGTPTCRSGRR